jgi:uncharacterized protein (TIGR00297 family)
MITETIVIIIVVAAGCIAGHRQKSLTSSGALSAFIVGMSVYAGFGVKGLLLLGIFFATSSFWSKYKSSKKAKIEEKLAKGSTRDWRQVFANGGLAAFLGLLHFFVDIPFLVPAFAAALASANSDTWASEIGTLSRRDPIDIRTFSRVEKGTSGAVSLLGSLAGLAGSLLIALFSTVLFSISLVPMFFVFLFGFIGNIMDTLLGGFLQKKYVCQKCGLETEKSNHCQQPTVRIKGISFIDNDMVNFLSGLIAAMLTLSAMLLIE